MTDTRLRRAWQRTRGRKSLLAQSHLDAFQDVRGPVDQTDLDALDAELRRAGDGPWLPAPVRYYWYGFRRHFGRHFGRDVTISGRPVEISPLESFSVTINAPPTPIQMQTYLDGLLFRFNSAELITFSADDQPHLPPDGPLVEEPS